jgi:hypothetical protein
MAQEKDGRAGEADLNASFRPLADEPVAQATCNCTGPAAAAGGARRINDSAADRN